MGSLGIPELVLIFVVALLLFGPRKLPEIGRTLGKALGEFKRATNDLKRTLEDEVAAEDLRRVSREVKEATTLSAVSGSPAQPPPAPPPASAAPEAPPQEPAADKPIDPT